MQCKACGTRNSFYSRHCIKCGNYLIETDNKDSSEYCLNCGTPLLYPSSPCPECSKTASQEDQTTCYGCNQTLKKGLLFSNLTILSEFDRNILDISTINYYCDKCATAKRAEASQKLDNLKKQFQDYLGKMPVLSVENPSNLTIIKYCGIVTGKSMAKIDKARTKDFERKMALAEKDSLASLKKQALKFGANTIVRCDIEYSELTDLKNVFLIAMMGTAVIVEEFDILTDYEQRIFNYLERKSLN